jgi:hypothetical protein
MDERSRVMRPNPVQQRLVVMVTAVMTFLAGVFAATGRGHLFVATLLLLVVALFLIAVLRPGEKSGASVAAGAGPNYASQKRGI